MKKTLFKPGLVLLQNALLRSINSGCTLHDAGCEIELHFGLAFSRAKMMPCDKHGDASDVCIVMSHTS